MAQQSEPTPSISNLPLDTTIIYEYDFNPPSKSPLTIRQDPTGALAGGVGATVWDSALVAAKYLEKRLVRNPSDFADKRVVEVGSGTGLLGLVTARIATGAREVVLTDREMSLPLLKVNVKEQPALDRTAPVQVVQLDWTSKEDAETLGTFDVILVADCVVWPELFAPLVDTLGRISRPGTELILAYERRNFDQEVEFFALLGEMFSFRNVPDEEQDELYKAEDLYLFTGKRK
ncbi:Methyltransferase-like protein 21D [Rhizophlyctis rosea]|nr:Methyltransferase-like protein 21D [Rhizophlyctis rosea]